MAKKTAEQHEEVAEQHEEVQHSERPKIDGIDTVANLQEVLSNYPPDAHVVIQGQFEESLLVGSAVYDAEKNMVTLSLGELSPIANDETFLKSYENAAMGNKGGEAPTPAGEGKFVQDDTGRLHSVEGTGKITAEEMGHLGGQRTAQLVSEAKEHEAEHGGPTQPYGPAESGEIINASETPQKGQV